MSDKFEIPKKKIEKFVVRVPQKYEEIGRSTLVFCRGRLNHCSDLLFCGVFVAVAVDRVCSSQLLLVYIRF